METVFRSARHRHSLLTGSALSVRLNFRRAAWIRLTKFLARSAP